MNAMNVIMEWCMFSIPNKSMNIKKNPSKIDRMQQ